MRHKCYSKNSVCAGVPACEGAVSKLWHQGTGGTVELCRAHGKALQDADEKWISTVVANAILERDRAVDVAKGNLRVAAEQLLGPDARHRATPVVLEALYVAARELVAAENARKEILR